MNIQPGDIVTRRDGIIGIAQSEPFQPSGWLGQEWWRVIVEWQEDGDTYQMGWCCDGIIEVERNGFIVFGVGAITQMELWNEAS